MEDNLTAGLFHAAASLGIAEPALADVTRSLAERRSGVDSPRTRMLAAEGAIELSASRAALSRAALLIDEHYAANPARDGTGEEVIALFAEAQRSRRSSTRRPSAWSTARSPSPAAPAT